MGIYFSPMLMNDTISGDTIIHVTPQINNNPALNPLVDTVQWIEISGSFTANGNEKFFIIGNFDDDTLTDTASNNLSVPWTWSFYYFDDVLVTPCDSLTEISENSVFDGNLIFPNPTSGILNLNFNANNPIDISVFDLAGKVIRSKEDKNSNRIKTIDLTSLPSGIYLVKVTTTKKIFYEKIIINH